MIFTINENPDIVIFILTYNIDLKCILNKIDVNINILYVIIIYIHFI